MILLPLLVFLRAYPLYFLEQFGPDWQIIPEESVVAVTGKESPGEPYGYRPDKY